MNSLLPFLNAMRIFMDQVFKRDIIFVSSIDGHFTKNDVSRQVNGVELGKNSSC